jgi:hypothetical protein
MLQLATMKAILRTAHILILCNSEKTTVVVAVVVVVVTIIIMIKISLDFLFLLQ